MKYLFILFLCLITVPSMAQKSLNLDDALELAMANSPDMLDAKLRLERSQQSLIAQKAALKSQFSLRLTPFEYNRDREYNTFFSTWNTAESKASSSIFTISQPLVWTDGTVSLVNSFGWRDSYSEYQDKQDKSFSNNLALRYTQPIFTYNRIKLSMRELLLDLENSEMFYTLQKLNIETRVAQDFYTVYAQTLSHQIALEELTNQEQSYQIMKNKVDAGLAALEELYQAELNLASSRQKVQNSTVTLSNAKDELKRSLGISIFEEIDVVADVSYQVVEIDLQKALDTGLSARTELRQREIDIASAKNSLIQTAALNEFRGDLEMRYGIIGTDEDFESVYEKPTYNQRFSISFDIPLFDWGESRARKKASEASVEMSELNLEDEKTTIVIGIRQAFRSIKNLEIQIEIARQSVKNAQLTYDINLEKYKNGDLTSMDLNLYQIQLSEQKIALTQALIDYRLALLNLKVQSMWDFVRNEPVLPEIEDINNSAK
ncbi:TolC family protein [candidate division KSB1 bacterium]|nr:TolC family protein [candidate division KSB1 bacterium]